MQIHIMGVQQIRYGFYLFDCIDRAEFRYLRDVNSLWLGMVACAKINQLRLDHLRRQFSVFCRYGNEGRSAHFGGSTTFIYENMSCLCTEDVIERPCDTLQ